MPNNRLLTGLLASSVIVGATALAQVAPETPSLIDESETVTEPADQGLTTKRTQTLLTHVMRSRRSPRQQIKSMPRPIYSYKVMTTDPVSECLKIARSHFQLISRDHPS